jgi:hypothetical protein
VEIELGLDFLVEAASPEARAQRSPESHDAGHGNAALAFRPADGAYLTGFFIPKPRLSGYSTGAAGKWLRPRVTT